MKYFQYATVFCLSQFVLCSCNRHSLYRAGGSGSYACSTAEMPIANSQRNFFPGKLVIGRDEFKIESEQDIAKVIKQATLALQKLRRPFLCIEHDIDDKHYHYGPSEDYPGNSDRQIAHRVDKGFKNNLSISRDLYVVGLSGQKYFLYPTGNRAFARRPADNGAYYVAQHQVCYATDKKMGTDNVQNCVALIVQDKTTGKTALAHVSTASLNLVNELLAYMPKGPKDVILVSGQHKPGKCNLKDILRRLLQYNDRIAIVQSYCRDTRSLSFSDEENKEWIATSFYDTNTNFGNVIVDPKGLKITTGSPTLTIPADCKIEYAHYDLDKVKTSKE